MFQVLLHIHGLINPDFHHPQGQMLKRGPSNSCIYTVTGTSSGCSSTATISVRSCTFTQCWRKSGCNRWSVLGIHLLSMQQEPVNFNGSRLPDWVQLTVQRGMPVRILQLLILWSDLPVPVQIQLLLLTVNPFANSECFRSGSDLCRWHNFTFRDRSRKTYSWSPSMYLNSVVEIQSLLSRSDQRFTQWLQFLRVVAIQLLSFSLSPPLPVVSVLGSDSICFNASTTLSAYGATLYQWSPAAGLNSISGSFQ